MFPEIKKSISPHPQWIKKRTMGNRYIIFVIHIQQISDQTFKRVRFDVEYDYRN